MKTNILKTLIFFLFVVAATAQQGINYKALIKDANGDAIANTSVSVQFTIIENGTTDVYSESHNPTTDDNGIVIVNIGEGTLISGDFNTIYWGSNPHFLKTEIDSGDGLTDMGTTEFKAVPYAIHVDTANRALLDEVDDADADPENELQTLTLVDNTLNLSDGGSVELPLGNAIEGQYYYADKDGDGFGYMYEAIWVLDGIDPPAFYVNNSIDCNDEDFYTQDGSPEICDGIDNDCDGQIDEGFELFGSPCTVGIGGCQTVGYYDCSPDGTSLDCNAEAGTPSEEICDGIDNDCNGQIDENLNPPLNPLQEGVCAGSLQRCNGYGGWVEDYSGVAGYEYIEFSCDGLDNDGDGEIDENCPPP